MIYAEILAGGKGSRMGNTEMPKQFLNIKNKPIIIHTIEKFLVCKKIDKIIVITPEQWIQHTKDIINKYIKNDLNKICICVGGSDRNKSIINGIKYIKENFSWNDEDIVITHDAVRPFITNRIIDENIDMAIKYGATDTVISAIDTIVKSDDGKCITDIPLRSTMFQGQTPQSFNMKILKELYDSLSTEEKECLTDAAKIFVLRDRKVKLVEGEIFNIKITTQYDLKIANALVCGDIND